MAGTQCRTDEDALLRRILEGTATETGERFYRALVENVGKALEVRGAWVTEYLEERRTLRSLAFWLDGEFAPQWEYPIDGTPCAIVVDERRLVHIPDRLIELFPEDAHIRETGAVSYMGVPLLDLDGVILGHLGVFGVHPLHEEARLTALFRIFADRAAAEFRRLRAESERRGREEELAGLIDSAMDAIVRLDDGYRVSLLNAAAAKMFACEPRGVIGEDFGRFVTDESRARLIRLIEQLDAHPEGQQHVWIPSGLTARRADGTEFSAEATVSRFEVRGRTFHTVILRNVDERLKAERRIRSLTDVTEYLREEIRALEGFEEIVGQSPAMRSVLLAVRQVAETGATVLIQGETGTGKELIARAIHMASRRRERPLIRVNCAAIPSTLIESEFFGHERGAFTGATQRREGRFSLADKGTIFLDEIGELPLDLQSKLLRILQEGEFELVGSAATRHVDVRVIAATNRDLQTEVREGRFREDLFYRLNVFPIHVPPLRERPEDIAPLAYTFAKRYANRMARPVPALTDHCVRLMCAYHWPGNVRELQNIIERAVILSQCDRLDLSAVLPERPSAAVRREQSPSNGAGAEILTVSAMQRLERENLIRALEAANWKVSGEDGAARILGMKPSTLSSRMKALGIARQS